ncbi:MAG: excinuclease ABC subunit UvrC, partial [Actinomycetes bacterium]
RLRDRLLAVQRTSERQQIVGSRDEQVDVVGVVEDDLEAAAQVFHVRHGRVVGRNGFVLDKVMDLSPEQTIAAVLDHLYGDVPVLGVPREVLVPVLPDEPDLYESWLSEARGTRVTLRVPQRGPKRELAETVRRNAEEQFTRHRLKRAADHNSRARALNELQEALGLPEAPLRIECYDMSHLQGSDYVGSMVVMEDGLPRKSEYRRFKVREVPGNDDFAAMEEVLTRRLVNYVEERDLPAGERGRFSYPPQLLLVDGGKGQLGVAVKVLEQLGLSGEIPVASLAKRFEEVYVPGRSAPVELPRGSEALFMLQRLRDETHRFAVSYHRQLRDSRMTRSVLDGIPGLGEVRRARLVKAFGGVRAVQRASLDDLLGVSWLPDDVGRAIFSHLHPAERVLDASAQTDG